MLGGSSFSGPAPAVLGVVVASMLLMVAAHESAHIAALKALGVRASIGLLPLGVYVSFDEEVSKSAFTAVALAPLLLSPIYLVAGLLLRGALGIALLMMYVFNTAGAAGDLYLVALVNASKGVRSVRDEGKSIVVSAEGLRKRAVDVAVFASLAVLFGLAAVINA